MPSFARIRQIAIPVRDIDSARAFYRDILGMKHLFDAPPALAFFDCGGVRLMLSGPEAGGKDADSQHPVLFYDVTDIRKVFADLQRAGVASVEEPHIVARVGGSEVWIAFIGDGQGNMVGMMSEVPVST